MAEGGPSGPAHGREEQQPPPIPENHNLVNMFKCVWIDHILSQNFLVNQKMSKHIC